MFSDRSFSPANSISADSSLTAWVTECSPAIPSTKRRRLEFATVMASRMGLAIVGGRLWSMAPASNFHTWSCVYYQTEPKVRGFADSVEGEGVLTITAGASEPEAVSVMMGV